MPDLEELRATRALAALGNRTRLRVFRTLVRAGAEGLNVGALQSLLEIPGSTLAHHVSTLAQAGLVVQQRRGREVVLSIDFAVVSGLLTFLTEECCAGVTVEDNPRASRSDAA